MKYLSISIIMLFMVLSFAHAETQVGQDINCRAKIEHTDQLLFQVIDQNRNLTVLLQVKEQEIERLKADLLKTYNDGEHDKR